MKKDTRSFLVEHELQVNGIIGRLLYLSCLVGPVMFIMTKLGIFEVDIAFCMIFTVCAILMGVTQQLLTKNPRHHTIARYYGIIMLELLIGLSATRAAVGVYIAYAFATMLSCLYVNIAYTRFVCVFSYFIMVIAMYFRSINQVENHYILESQMRYFIIYTAGFTIEFILLFLICDTIVRHEKSLLIGQKNELMDRLEAEEESKAKSDFLAQMSHEIRTPINAVLGMNEMILRETTQPEIERYARTIRNAGKSLLAIVNDILDFSKIQSGRMEIIPVEYDSATLLRDLVELYRVQAISKGLDFQYHISEELPRRLVGDEYRIKQAAGNLISNAIKYTSEGFVNIQVDFIPTEKEEYGRLVFSVIDSGIGIKTEDMPKLFQSFGRVDLQKNRSIEGTGLGLKISKQLIEMMGGTLTVQSVYEEGSIFSITILQQINSEEKIGEFALKLEKLQEEVTTSSQTNEVICAKDARIMIVDDNEMNLQVASSLLKKTQSTIDCVLSGKECLELVKENHYDLILLDHMMPEMDGIETLHALRDNNPDVDDTTKIVVLTANAIVGAKEKYLEEGFDDYISKPIAFAELDRVLLEQLPVEKLRMYQMDEKKSELFYPDLSEYGIDVMAGIELLGDYDVYIEMAKVFCMDYESKTEKMNEALEQENMADYAILVHGLKSNARTLGANELGELAYEEEMASKDANFAFIQSHVETLRQSWIRVLEGFSVLLEEEDEFGDENDTVEVTLEPLSDSELEERMLIILACVEEYQQSEAEIAINELLAHSLDEEFKAALYEARKQLRNFEYEKTFETLKSFIKVESEDA